MTKLCQKTGCGQPATHALQIGVGDVQDPDEAPPRVTMLLGIVVCEECMEGESADRFLSINPSLQSVVAISMGEGCRPDFDRAVLLGVPVDSDEYRRLQLEGILQKKAH